jgi:hypothetical protein
MGNVLLIKIKKDNKLEAIDAIEVAKSKTGGLIHHHRLDLGNFSWYMDSSEMLEELRDLMFDVVDELNKSTKSDATTGLNTLQFDLFNSVIRRIKGIYSSKAVNKVSYLVQDDSVLKDGSLPVMEWVAVPKK